MVYVYLYCRLGNNIGQLAAAANLARKLNTDFAAYPMKEYFCPEPDNCSFLDYLEPFKSTIFRKIKFVNEIPEDIRVIRDSDVINSWDEVEIKEDEDVFLNGYFLKPNLLDRDLCRSYFGIHERLKKDLIAKYNITEDVGSVVVRRGDYVRIPHQFTLCGRSYYFKSMGLLEKSEGVKRWLIISDDLDWCRNVFGDDNRYVYVDEPPLNDLYIPTLCRCNIISNSTFAWWGAYLNDTKCQKVIFPTPWYGWSFRDNEPKVREIFCNQKNWYARTNVNIWCIIKGFLLHHYLLMSNYKSRTIRFFKKRLTLIYKQ